MDAAEKPEPELWAAAGAPAEVIALGAVRLRAWGNDDAEALYAAALTSLSHLQPWMPWATDEYASDIAGVIEFLGRGGRQWDERTSFNYALVDATSDAILGSFSLMGRVGPGSLEIGYWVHVEHTGQGLATRAAAALTEAGLTIPGVDAIEIHHDEGNVFSGRVPPRLGYVRLRDQAADLPAKAGTGIHVVWGMERAAWPGSSGEAILKAARG